MYCEKCGTENQFEGAAFCKNCHHPLQPKPVASSKEHSGIADSTDLNLKGQTMAEPQRDGAEDDRIDMADPIDFIMGESGYDDGVVSSKGPDDPIEPEPIENDLTVYRDNEIKLTLSGTESGPNLTLETLGSRKGDEIEAMEDNESVVEKNEAASGENDGENEPDGEEIMATQKIRLQNLKDKFAPQAEEIDEPRESEPAPLDLPRVARSRGIILLSGETLTLTGGARVFPGDEVQIGDQLYEVRTKPKDNRWIIGAIAGGAALILLLLVLLGTFSGGQNGQIVGMVFDDATGGPLSEQSIHIAELKKTVQTNQAGFFVFDDLPSGLFTIQYLRDGIPIAEERVAVLENDITTVTLYKGEPIASTPTGSSTSQGRKESTAESNSKTEPGTLKLTLSPDGAAAYLDDKPLGVGSNSYKVRPGRYILSVKKKGYETKSRQITVNSGKSLSYKYALSEEKPTPAKKKSDGELAYENEIAGNYDEALRHYDKILQKNPQDLRAMLGKARSFRAQGQLDQATSHFTQAARIAANKGDIATQIEALTGVIDARPNTFTAYYSRGDLYSSQGDYQRAARDYEKVIQIDHRNLGAYYKLGNSYYQTQDYNDALAAFKGAEELNFADPKAHVYLAETYLALNDRKNMKKSYEKFTELASYSARPQLKNDPEWQKVLSAMGAED
jgi:tetratricopeptide (TPR) repeat protein